MPKVAHITFLNGTGTLAELVTSNAITLQCNITISGLTYNATDWKKNGYFIL